MSYQLLWENAVGDSINNSFAKPFLVYVSVSYVPSMKYQANQRDFMERNKISRQWRCEEIDVKTAESTSSRMQLLQMTEGNWVAEDTHSIIWQLNDSRESSEHFQVIPIDLN